MLHPSEALVIAIAGLFLGPLLVLSFPTKTSWKKVIDGFALVTIGGLSLLELIPTAIEESGWIILIPLLFGFVGPWFLESKLKDANNTIIIAAVFLLGLHCLIDGMMLISPSHEGHNHFNHQLATGILVHRLPVGVFVFAAIQARLNTKLAIGSMIYLSGATYLGFALGQQFYEAIPVSIWSMIQACVAGGLCHVLFHQHDKINSIWSKQNQLFGSLGVLFGATILYQSGWPALAALIVAGPVMTLSISLWPTLSDAKTYVAYSLGAATVGFGLEEWLHYRIEHDHLKTMFSIPVMIGIGLMFTRMATNQTDE